MKCTNCGNEVTGKFCTQCGTPAPIAQTNTQPVQNEQPVQPMDWQQTEVLNNEQPADTYAQQNTYDAQPNNSQQSNPYQGYNAQSYDYTQSADKTNPNQTSFGQQFTNAQGEFHGQQFTNSNAAPAKKSHKTAIIVAGVIGVLVITLIALVIFFIFKFSGDIAEKVSSVVSEVSKQIEDERNESSEHSFIFNKDDSSDLSSSINEDKDRFDKATGFSYRESNDYDGIVITDYEMDSRLYDNKNITVRVPEKIDGETVVEIESIWVWADESYVKVIIPGTVKKIDSYAMSFTDSIDEVVIEEGVEIIDYYAFIGSENLKKVTVPKSVIDMDDCGIGYTCDDDYNDVKMKDFVLYGKKGSAAEGYAKEHGFKFIAN